MDFNLMCSWWLSFAPNFRLCNLSQLSQLSYLIKNFYACIALETWWEKNPPHFSKALEFMVIRAKCLHNLFTRRPDATAEMWDVQAEEQSRRRRSRESNVMVASQALWHVLHSSGQQEISGAGWSNFVSLGDRLLLETSCFQKYLLNLQINNMFSSHLWNKK